MLLFCQAIKIVFLYLAIQWQVFVERISKWDVRQSEFWHNERFLKLFPEMS